MSIFLLCLSLAPADDYVAADSNRWIFTDLLEQASSNVSASSSAAEGAKAKAKAKTKSKEKAGPKLPGSEAPGLCQRVPGVGRGVMMGVYVQDLMRLDGGGSPGSSML